ncbi:MAG: protein phosphatase 2C domain-containing protein [Magnetococcus sp. YQC-5]
MMWRLVYASDIGTSHAHSDVQCQDRCWAQVLSLLNRKPLLSIFVSDGAGSAARGENGAELAIKTAADFVTKKAMEGEFGLSDILATEIVITLRERIYAVAESQNLSARDFACTFLGILSTDNGTLVLQIGDGGVVVDTGSGLEVAIEPMSGEYANMTRFVTDDDAVSILATKTYPDRALKAAVFTDGIQRLALNLATNTPHLPFFAPFFNGIDKASDEQMGQLNSLLNKFLGSPPVNDRTDDDKTLALALWMP